MGIKAPAKVKFQLICDALRTRGNCLSVSLLCRVAGVSRSGFYAWTAAAPARLERDEKDRAEPCPADVHQGGFHWPVPDSSDA